MVRICIFYAVGLLRNLDSGKRVFDSVSPPDPGIDFPNSGRGLNLTPVDVIGGTAGPEMNHHVHFHLATSINAEKGSIKYHDFPLILFPHCLFNFIHKIQLADSFQIVFWFRQ